MSVLSLLDRAHAAKGSVAYASAEEKDRLLLAMADSLRRSQEEILAANAADLQAAREIISEVMQDRLRLTPDRLMDAPLPPPAKSLRHRCPRGACSPGQFSL